MANSVTARFNDNCKVHVAMSNDTTVTKAVIIDADGNETDIGGGGGESDFSTAKVSVENNTEALINGMFVALYDTPFSAVVPENTLPSMSRNYNVPLYKGVCSWSFMVDTISVSGNIEWDSENRIALIKGDGTITVS